jgi:hypothetical protein
MKSREGRVDVRVAKQLGVVEKVPQGKSAQRAEPNSFESSFCVL